MQLRPWPNRLFALLAALSTLALTADAWGQAPAKTSKESKAVTKVIDKVDRQILSYSPEKARELLEPVLEDKDPRVGAAMGQILILEDQYDEGLAKLKSAAKSSANPMIDLALGDAQVVTGKRGPAKSDYTAAAEKAEALLAADPNNYTARFALGAAQRRLNQNDEAITNLTRARTGDARDPRIPFELGMARMSQGNHQAAFDELSQAIELYSGYAYAYYYRALAANQIDRKDITVNDLDRFLALAPNAPEAAKAQRILQAARG